MITKKHTYNVDPLIIPRVKQYLEDNVHQTYVDVGEMAKTLQERHREYQRRKVDMFRMQVEQAYKTVLHSYGLDSNPGTDLDDEDGSDLEETRQNSGGHMNDALQQMYTKPKSQTAVSSTNDGELIDISSDEEGQEGTDTTIKQKILCTTNNVTITKIAGDVSNTNGDKLPINEAISTHSVDNSYRMTRPGQPVYLKLKQPSGVSHAHDNQQLNKKRRIDSPAEHAPLPKPFKMKKFKKEVLAAESNVNFSDVGGNDKTLKDLCELILHIKHPEIYRHIGLPPPRGFLLNGAPGTGKTLLARAIAGQLDVLLVEVPATELVAGVSGESEERIRDIFEQAAALAPCVLFIDEIDAISSNRLNASKDMERRIVSQLLNSLDNLSKLPFGDQVLVIGATNRTDALDPSLRRVGRFDHEISLGIPDREARSEILRIIAKNLKLEVPFDFEEVAALTPGYVGADLLALCTRAASSAVKRIISQKEHEILLKNLAPKPNQNDVIAIVNIDDDPILMEVDDQVTVNGEADIPVIEEKEKEIIEIIAEKDDAETTTTTTEAVKDSIIAENAPIPADDTMNEKVIEEQVTPAAEPLEFESTVTEKIPETIEIEPVVEKEETLADAVLARSSLKLQLTLENMIKWLNYSNVPLSPAELKNLSIQRNDFLDALKHVQPSAKREGFITVPDVTWEDIGSLQDIRDELKLAILAPVKFPQRLKLLGLQSPTGVLLCGPPGCGKTLLAKAVANEAGINFISVKGPELLNMYVGESERAVRQVFQRARNSAPCVIFFDEFDSLCPKRSDNGDSGSSMRVVNQLLTEMDGIEDRKGVFLMAATNRPDIVDPAVMRPGRLDKILYVGLPMAVDRLDILNALTKNGTKPPLAEDVDMQQIANLTEGYTGADLAGLVRQASLQTLKDSILLGNVEDSSTEDLRVYMKHFLDVHRTLKPSVNKEDIKHYKALKDKYGHKDSE